MNHRVHLIAERLWGAIAVIALLAAAWHLSRTGWEEGKSVLLFPAIAGCWFLTRRALRKKLSASEHRPEDGA